MTQFTEPDKILLESVRTLSFLSTASKSLYILRKRTLCTLTQCTATLKSSHVVWMLWLNPRLKEIRGSNSSLKLATPRNVSRLYLDGVLTWNSSIAWWCSKRKILLEPIISMKFLANLIHASLNWTSLNCLVHRMQETSRNKIGMGSVVHLPFGMTKKNSSLLHLFSLANNSPLKTLLDRWLMEPSSLLSKGLPISSLSRIVVPPQRFISPSIWTVSTLSVKSAQRRTAPFNNSRCDSIILLMLTLYKYIGQSNILERPFFSLRPPATAILSFLESFRGICKLLSC